MATNKQLIKKLEQAYQVCRDCGFKYGVYSVGCSSTWLGKCDVCDETKPITESRDYGYLVTGIRKLKLGGKDPAPQPKKGDAWRRTDDPLNLYIYDGKEWVTKPKLTPHPELAKCRPFSELTKDFTPERKEKIKDQTKATIRCIPLNNPLEHGKCILTGNPSTQRVMFARAY
jgi:hypothetical protein